MPTKKPGRRKRWTRADTEKLEQIVRHLGARYVVVYCIKRWRRERGYPENVAPFDLWAKYLRCHRNCHRTASYEQ